MQPWQGVSTRAIRAPRVELATLPVPQLNTALLVMPQESQKYILIDPPDTIATRRTPLLHDANSAACDGGDTTNRACTSMATASGYHNESLCNGPEGFTR